MSKIVVFIGKMGSGKNFETKKYLDMGYLKYSFADELRKSCYGIIGYIPVNYDKFKERLIYLDEFPTFITKLLKCTIPCWKTGRELLQDTSDEFKKYNKRIWIDSCINAFSEAIGFGNNIVVDDLRTKAELVALQQYSANNNIDLEVYFCDYRSKKYEMHSKHNSEKLAEYLRDELKFQHLQQISIDKCFYYKQNGKTYKTAVPIEVNTFLEERDLLNLENLNDFEKIVINFKESNYYS